MKAAVLEGRVGGGWYELGEDGSRCEWGKVLVWDPPRRVVITWQITAQWQFDPGFVTAVVPSTGTTASAPSGSTAPVEIRTA